MFRLGAVSFLSYCLFIRFYFQDLFVVILWFVILFNTQVVKIKMYDIHYYIYRKNVILQINFFLLEQNYDTKYFKCFLNI